MEFLRSEEGFIIVSRLDILCGAHCEDLALRLAGAILKCIKTPGIGSLASLISTDQIHYVLDIYLALLHKFDQIDMCIAEVCFAYNS